ncbi:hypothetical protein [Nocardioides sp. KR10-350]|uniref:hypothetical protein n=1 Tax=Nocardioides cheoyonin TaxID=3156615 RepID=UPI0032B5C4CF
MSLDAARRLADTVLYEGYVLYPYRASAAKNRVRWQWGVLMPPAVAEADPSERSGNRTDLLVDGPARSLRVTVRFLQVQRRTVEDAFGAPVERLETREAAYVPWDEAREQELTLEVPLDPAADGRVTRVFEVDGGTEREEVEGGELVRVREPLRVAVAADVCHPSSPYAVTQVTLRVRNETPVAASPQARRPEWLRHALVACHLLLEAPGARFVSLLDPPQWAAGFVAECEQDGVFPVLAAPDDSVVLSSPIILYDHAEVAPESETGFFDSLEIDELLSLRTATLTEDERREVRGTDPRAAALLGEVDAMSDELWERLHGTLRYLDSMTSPESGPESGTADPEEDTLEVGGVTLRRGSRVLLRPGVRRADAHDLFLAGRTATVAAVHHDYDGRDHLAVTVDDDPGSELKLEHGRYLYFAPDEVEPFKTPRPSAPQGPPAQEAT